MPRNDWDLESATYSEGIPPDDYAEYQAYLDTLDVNDHPPEVVEHSFLVNVTVSEEPPW
jgi:hypothetical protein